MPRTDNERRVVALTSGAHALTHLYLLVFPATVLPLVRDTGLPLAEVVEAAFPGYLLFGLGALPAGWLTDRWSARGMLAVCLLGAGSMACLCGLSPSLPWLSAAHGGLGLFLGIYHPAAISLVTRTVRRRGRALGQHGMAGNLGLAAAPFVAGLLATTLGWRAAWGLLGLPALALGAVVLLWRLDETEVEEARDAGAGAGSGPAHPVLPFVLLCGGMALGGLAFDATSVAIPATFELRVSLLDALVAPLESIAPGGTATIAATALASLAYLVGVGGQALGGYVADRFDLRLAYVALPLLAVPFSLVAGWLSEGWLVVGAAGYVVFGLGVQPVENALIARLTPGRLRGSAYGVKFLLAYGVGSAAVPAVAALERSWGLPVVFVAVAGAMAGVAGLGVGLWVVTRRGYSSVSSPRSQSTARSRATASKGSARTSTSPSKAPDRNHRPPSSR